AKIFGDREARESNTGARTRRLVHLAVHQRTFRALDRALVRVLVHARFDHLMIEVVTLTRAFADAGKHRIAAVRFGNVIDQFHDQDGLAHASTAEQTYLTTLGVRREQV